MEREKGEMERGGGRDEGRGERDREGRRER